MTNVTHLAEASNGLSPALRNATEAFRKSLNDLVDAAWDANLPAGLIVGLIEIAKHDFMERTRA